jgi:hypothetical protein
VALLTQALDAGTFSFSCYLSEPGEVELLSVTALHIETALTRRETELRESYELVDGTYDMLTGRLLVCSHDEYYFYFLKLFFHSFIHLFFIIVFL